MKLFILTNHQRIVADVMASSQNANAILIGPAASITGGFWHSITDDMTHIVTDGVPARYEHGYHWHAEPSGGMLNAAQVVRSVELADEAAFAWRSAIAEKLNPPTLSKAA